MVLTAANVAFIRCKNLYVELYLNHSLMSDVSMAFMFGPLSRTIKFGRASLSGFKAFGCNCEKETKKLKKIVLFIQSERVKNGNSNSMKTKNSKMTLTFLGRNPVSLSNFVGAVAKNSPPHGFTHSNFESLSSATDVHDWCPCL